MLARETGEALASFLGEDANLLIAGKQVLARQPTAAQLVWLVANVLAAPNQRKALWQAVDELEDDNTHRILANELPSDACVCVIGWPDALSAALRKRRDLRILAVETDTYAERRIERLLDDEYDAACVPLEGMGQAVAESTHVIFDVQAVGPGQAIAPQPALAAAAVARHWKVPVWALGGVGVVLPQRMYDGLTRRWHESDPSSLWCRMSEELPNGLVDALVMSDGLHVTAERAFPTTCPVVPELF